MSGIVIIGAGHAGGSVAGFLRQYGYDGQITLLGAEPYGPYQRPPLSKGWLKGELDEDDLYLKSEAFYADKSITLSLNTTVISIDRAAKSLKLNDGHVIHYEHLIIATGSKARPFDVVGADKTPYFVLRSLDDAKTLMPHLKPKVRIGMIGAGYVGLEVAASARKLGCEVTIFERESRILSRIASRELSAFFSRVHRDNGVEILCDTNVTGVSQDQAKTRLTLSDERVFDFDALIVGIGALANDALARDCDIMCDNGIIVDQCARTQDPNIFAIGDVTSRTVSPFYQGRYRLESVPNALEQAKQCAAAITRYRPPPPEVPWFWSDQYDYKLQIAGLSVGTTQIIMRGDPKSGSFSVFQLDHENRLICCESINQGSDFMAAKLLIAKAVVLDVKKISDPNESLKPFLVNPS